MLPDSFLPSSTPRPGALSNPWMFAFRGNELLVSDGSDVLRLPSTNVLMKAGVAQEHLHYIGEWREQACFALDLPSDWVAPSGWRTLGLRQTYTRLDEPLFWIAGRAQQILVWDRSHRYCGTCGDPTDLKEGERARVCPSCGMLAYPRISPAVMVLITRGRELLLLRSPHFPPGVFSALAGFVEPGETLEQTVAREVKEEVGVEVKNLQYFGSQSWPFPHSLMLAFTAEYAGGEIKPDGVEIEAANWFDVDQVPKLPFPASIAHRLIATVSARLRKA